MFSLLSPLVCVAIIFKSYGLGLFQKLVDEGVDCISFLNFFLSLDELFGKSCTDHGHRPSRILWWSQSSKFKFVACVSERRCSVSVSILLENVFLKEKELTFQVFFGWCWVSVNNCAYWLTQIGWDDSGRSLVATESDFISWFSYGSKIKWIVFLDSREGKENEESEKRNVFLLFRHREQIFKLVILVNIVNWPVCVFSTSIELYERFFMKKSRITFLFKEFFDQFHGKKVLIDSFSCISIKAWILELVIGHFIVPGFERKAYFKELIFNFP